MSDLSPAAKVVLDGYWNAPDPQRDYGPDALERVCIAAALRAAVVSAPHEYKCGERWIRAGVLTAIATELENAS